MLDPHQTTAQDSSDPWYVAWRVATSDGTLAVFLLVAAIALAATAWLPQMSSTNHADYGRQLFLAQARFGEATRLIQSLGLFRITSTVGFRALLALLSGLLLVRLVESTERLWAHREPITPTSEWQDLSHLTLDEALWKIRRLRYRVVKATLLVQADRWPWAEAFPLLAHLGAVLLLSGLLLNAVWGWSLEGVVLQSGQRLTIPESDHWVMLDDADQRVTHSHGIQTPIIEHGPGVRVTAVDRSGHSLSLLQKPDAAKADELILMLTEDPYLATRETQFAIPQANLVFRVMPQAGHDIGPLTPILVQAYRSPSGQLAAEMVIADQLEFAVDDTTVLLAQTPYAQVSVIFQPGLGLTLIGVVSLVSGVVGSIIWPVRRLWLRNGGEHPTMGTGALPMALTARKEN